MNKKAYNIYTVATVAVIIFIISAACLLFPKKDFSESERRSLAKFPEFSAETFINGKFMSSFEDYALDQFPFRDSFRSLKAFAQYKIFNFKDNNGIYIKNDFAVKLIYPLNDTSVLNAAAKFGEIYDRYFSVNNNKIILSIVPDKGYFLSEDGGYPTMDYNRLEKLLTENMPYAEYCSIMEDLSAENYYKTDTHWKQEDLFLAAKRIASALGYELEENYTESNATDKFYGVYYGQAALPLAPDSINYITNDAISSAIVYNTETGTYGGVYDFEKLNGKDPYEFFLSGAAALLIIENPTAIEKKELVIFRDSFGSSIAPYFIEGYSKITLVDTRYIVPSLIGEYVDFSDCDVLFIYSTLVINESATLK